METPGKKFTDLVEIENPQDTDLMLIRNSTGVKNAPLQKLSDYIKQKFIGWVFSDLPTTDKTIPGALKELNSALATNTRTVTGIFVDLQIVRSGNVVWIRISSEAKKPMSRNQTYELFKLDIDLPIHSLYRRVQIDDSHGFFFRMTTDGQITLTPYTTDISQGDGVNVSEVYLSN